MPLMCYTLLKPKSTHIHGLERLQEHGTFQGESNILYLSIFRIQESLSTCVV